MWLFGLVTMIETTMLKMVEKHFPDESWKTVLSEERLLKAQEIWKERTRRNLYCQLVDCLQLTDKASILISNPSAYESLGFESAKQAKKSIKEFESLRNHLAHDWVQIARLVRRIDVNNQ